MFCPFRFLHPSSYKPIGQAHITDLPKSIKKLRKKPQISQPRVATSLFQKVRRITKELHATRMPASCSPSTKRRLSSNSSVSCFFPGEVVFCVFVFLCFCVFVFLCFCIFVFLQCTAWSRKAGERWDEKKRKKIRRKGEENKKGRKETKRQCFII